MSASGPLVTVFGGAGYIGCCLVRHLLDEGYRVRVFDNFLYGRKGIEDIESPHFEVIEGDICDARAVSRAVSEAESVVLLSAIVGRRAQQVKWSTMREVNFLASSVVLDAAIEYGAHRFIFASSDSVYGDRSGVMYETSIPHPVSLYSRLKSRMEERVINAKNRYFHPTALRIATCYGVSPRMRFDLVANALALDAIFKKELVVENGEQCRALVHVDDAARAFVSALKAHENLVSGEIFNVGAADQNVTVNQLVNIVKTLIPEMNVTIRESEPDLVDYHLSCSKIEKILDFSCQWSIEQSISQVRDLLMEGYFKDPYSLRYNNT